MNNLVLVGSNRGKLIRRRVTNAYRCILTLCISAKPSSIWPANTFRFCTVKTDSVEWI